MFITSLCAPAIVYIGFSLIQIIIDVYKGVLSEAFIRFVVMIVFSTIINILCNLGFTIIAWFLVFIPIIMMTIISSLLLKVFGLNPDEKNLRSKIKNSSDNDLDNSGNYLSGGNLLNQQKYSYFYDKFNAVKRIDRDDVREKLYDKIEDYYDLSINKKTVGQSNNILKVFLADDFINSIYNSKILSDIRNSNLYKNLLPKNTNKGSSYSTYYEKRYDTTLDISSSSYGDLYNQAYGGLIDEGKTDISYNPYNFSTLPKNKNISGKHSDKPCPINETPATFRQKTGLNCYEICAPGQEKDADGICHIKKY